MKTKTLYVLIADCGYESYSTQYTFNDKLIEKLQAAYDEGRMTYDNGIGCDGDGFHYDTITVPAECTAESMRISVMDDNYADQFDA